MPQTKLYLQYQYTDMLENPHKKALHNFSVNTLHIRSPVKSRPLKQTNLEPGFL